MQAASRPRRGWLAAHWPLAVLLVGYVAYAGIYIWQSSFVLDGTRYFSLFDDGMTSMVYARNLADGEGLVWNPGERVEGFTNPLWTVYMAGVHLLPIPAADTSPAIQLSGLGFLLISLVLLYRITMELTETNRLAALAAVAMTAFYYPLNSWVLLGMEVSVLILILAVAVLLAIRITRDSANFRTLYLLLGLGTLVRMDMAVPYLVFWAYLLLLDPARRREHLRWGGVTLVAFLGGQTLARLIYYGELLPNTYYLKMTGVSAWLRIVRGAYVYAKFVWNFNWALWALPLAFYLTRRNRLGHLLMALFIAQSVYSIYVGGDAWEHRGGANRFISLGMPFFFALFAGMLENLRQWLSLKLAAPPLTGWISRLAYLAAVGLAILNFNALIDAYSLSALFLRGRPTYVTGNERNVTIGLFVKQITQPDASVAVTAAGATPYFSERYTIDLLGKSDAVVARGPMHIAEDMALIDLRPGHMKWDYSYSIGELKPDVVVQLWQGLTPDAYPYIEDYIQIRVPELTSYLPDGRMYLRRDSTKVRWDEVEQWIYGG